jgi:hypothetical protein
VSALLAPLDDAKHWRDRAAEMRALADDYKNREAAGLMNRLTDDSVRTADRAEDRAKHGCTHNPSALPKEKSH